MGWGERVKEEGRGCGLNKVDGNSRRSPSLQLELVFVEPWAGFYGEDLLVEGIPDANDRKEERIVLI